MKKLISMYQKYMFRPVLYKSVTRVSVVAVLMLLWDRYVSDGRFTMWQAPALLLGVVLLAWAWVNYLRLDGVTVHHLGEEFKDMGKKEAPRHQVHRGLCGRAHRLLRGVGAGGTHLLQYAFEFDLGRSAAHHQPHRRRSVRAEDMAEKKAKKQLVVGILAHVDSGKTTLSEAMLYRAGSIRRLGRVDNKDAFLDTDTLEKARGHHDLFQAGPAEDGPHRHHSAGHPRPCGFFYRDRADAAGAGLRGAGRQRHRRRPEPHRDPLASAAAVSYPHLRLYQQDGSARPGERSPSGAAFPPSGRGLRGLRCPAGRTGRGTGPLRRAPDGDDAGRRRPDGGGHHPRHRPAARLSLLVRRGPSAGERERIAGRG